MFLSIMTLPWSSQEFAILEACKQILDGIQDVSLVGKIMDFSLDRNNSICSDELI